ncbi:MAG: hypothetical protein QJR12_00975 [Mycobacterium sp.]|nr:hypothetical protein [Mycobacterium sp.]MDI3312896.1 hypothetical protein [Mycobacterium sp.]
MNTASALPVGPAHELDGRLEEVTGAHRIARGIGRALERCAAGIH